MFEVNAFIVTYLITHIMTKFTTQQCKPCLCDQVIISEVITLVFIISYAGVLRKHMANLPSYFDCCIQNREIK